MNTELKKSFRDWCAGCENREPSERCAGCAPLDVRETLAELKGYLVGRPSAFEKLRLPVRQPQ